MVRCCGGDRGDEGSVWVEGTGKDLCDEAQIHKEAVKQRAVYYSMTLNLPNLFQNLTHWAMTTNNRDGTGLQEEMGYLCAESTVYHAEQY